MSSTLAQKTIMKLRRIYGLPEQDMTDNEPQFVADKFVNFMKMNGNKHINCMPYHPSLNRAVDRFVLTFKRVMKAGEKDRLLLHQRLSNFLLACRTTPHAATNRTPSEMFIGRTLHIDWISSDQLVTGW